MRSQLAIGPAARKSAQLTLVDIRRRDFKAGEGCERPYSSRRHYPSPVILQAAPFLPYQQLASWLAEDDVRATTFFLQQRSLLREVLGEERFAALESMIAAIELKWSKPDCK
ncbi:hypothetical protein ACFJGW_15085 [Burkholderiaceae bacterium UC74_6]